MGVRPSELWGITWPLAAFYFDRAVRNWAVFVDSRTNEAEQAVRQRMRNRKGTEPFAAQARQVAFAKLLGLSTEAAYAPPPTAPGGTPGTKRNLDKVSVPKVLNAEGKKIDLSGFNS